MKTRSAELLSIWQYAEYGAMRVLTGWGREAGAWDDKLAMCHHAYLQAESVDTVRQRLKMFPGNPDAPVARSYETALNVLFLAPSWADAMGALHEILYPLLAQAYQHYIAVSHPVHEAPTHAVLREISAAKTPQINWYHEFQARSGYRIDGDYAGRVRAALEEVGFQTPLAAEAPFAQPVGKSTSFRMKKAPGRVPGSDLAPNIMPFLQLNWSGSVETRRLFFMIAYLWEMGVAESQLRWLFYADFMPWEFIRDEARHMWDESRHGNSGKVRLENFGLSIEDVGYSSYGAASKVGDLEAMTPRDVYEAFYRVTQIAETGYFKTKGYCFEDFRDGGDELSAEMMQFDIIDETSHTEYGRRWLEAMMQRAGIEEDYQARALQDRQQAFQTSGEKVALYQRFLDSDESVLPSDNDDLANACLQLKDARARAHYERLLETVRAQCPLSNAHNAPTRPHLPM